MKNKLTNLYVCDIKQCATTTLFDDFYSDKSKQYLLVQKAVAFMDMPFYATLDLVIAKNTKTKNIVNNDPPLTASYLKTKSPFYYRMSDTPIIVDAKRRERYIIEGIHCVRHQIRQGVVGDTIWFESPVTLHAQSAEDRKKGTFDGGNYYTESVKLYGETTYECYICAVRIRNIF